MENGPSPHFLGHRLDFLGNRSDLLILLIGKTLLGVAELDDESHIPRCTSLLTSWHEKAARGRGTRAALNLRGDAAQVC
jgi:hypothetical protein